MADKKVPVAYTADTTQAEAALRRLARANKQWAREAQQLADMLDGGLRKQERQVASLSDQYRSFARDGQRAAVQASQGFDKLGRSLDLSGPLSRTRTSLDRTLRVAREHEQAFTRLGTAGLAGGAAIAYGLKQAADASISFESTFAGVRKTVDATEDELLGLSRGFRDMALDIPVTVEELNRIGEAAGQLGVQNRNILSFSRVMADMGVATNLGSEEAATALARLANVTQMPQENFDRLGSTVVALGNNLATTESEIVEMGLRIAGAGAQVGLAESEILGLAGALSDVGINAEAGGSAISRVMIEIASQVETNGDKLEDFAAVAGMGAQQFAQAWRDDAAGALIAFVEGLGSMEERGGSTLQVLEDLEIREIRMRDALLRTSGAGDKLRSALELGNRAWEENNALTREAEQRYGTLESRIQLARNEVNDLLIDVGAALAPVIGAAADAVGDFAGMLSDLPEPVLAVGAGLSGLAAAAAIGGGGLLLLLPRIAQTREAFKTLNITGATTLRMLGRVGPAAVTVGGLLFIFSQNARIAGEATETLADAIERIPASDIAGRVEALQQALAEVENRDFSWWEKLLGFEYTTANRGAKALAENLSSIAEEAPEAAWELVEAAEAAGTLQRRADGSIAVLTDLGDATVLTAREAERLAAAWRAAESGGDSWARANRDTASAGRQIADALGLTGEAADEFADAIDGATTATEKAKSALELYAEAQEALWQSYGQFGGVSRSYQRLLDEQNAAERAAAEATAKATKDSKDSWEDYYTQRDEDARTFLNSLRTDLEAQRNYFANLDRIREVHGDEVADWYAEQTADRPQLLQQLVDEELAALDAGFETERTRREEHAREVLEQLIRSGEQIIHESGEFTADAVAAMGEALGVAPQDVERILGVDTVEAARGAFALLETLAGEGGSRAVQAMARQLGFGADQVADIVHGYAAELAAGLNPVLEGISAKAIVIGRMGRRRAANTGRTTTGISEFADGGFRPDAHIVTQPTVLYGEPETGGEAYIPLSPAKEPRSQAIWEEVGRRKGWQFFADGGFRSVADVPKPPRIGYGPHIGYAGQASAQYVHDEAVAWLEENLAPPLGPGIGWQAMWAALSSQFPGARLTSSVRPGSRTLSGNLSWHARGRAIDVVGPFRAIGQWIAEHYGPQTLELISPDGSGAPNLRHGRPHTYSAPIRAQHSGGNAHIHWAMANGGIIGEPVVGMGLRSGQSYAFGERGPEAVLPMADGGIVMPPLGQITTVAGRAAPSVASLRAALDEIDRLIARYEQLLRLQEENARRSELLADRQRAEKELAKATGDERKRAQERLRDAIVALQEFDRDRARANAEAAAQQQRLRIEEQLRIAENKAAWEFERMSAREQLRNIERRLAAEVRFTDAWVDLVRDRERVAAQVLDEERGRLRDLERTRDDAHQRLVRLLEDEQRIRQRMADAERRAAEESQRIVQARRDALVGWADLDRRANIDFGTSAAAISANIRDQIDAFEQWQQGLDELRARGLSEDVIAMLGLEDSPMALGQVQRFLADTDAELRELNRLVEERSRQVADRVKFEQDRLIGEVGRGLRGVAQDLAGELRDLNRELRDVGKDQGLSYGEAVAEGLRSSLAEVRKAARDLERAMAGVQVAESRVSQAEQTAAKAPPAKAVSREDAIPAKFRGGIVYRVAGTDEHYLKLGGKWYAATGAGQVAGVTSLYGAAREVPRNHIGPVADSVVNLFGGPGGIERLLASLPKFHSGIGSVPGMGERLAVVEGGERILSRVDNAMLVAAVRQAVTQPAAIGPVNVTARVFVGNQEITDIARVEAEVVVADQLREVAIAGQQVRGGR